MADNIPTHEIVSYKEAKASGLEFYFTGKICKRGHVSLRRTATCQCCKCGPIVQREWRIKNIEWVRRRNLNQLDKDRDKVRAQGRARYAKDPKKYVEKTKRYYLANGEDVRKKRKAYHYEIYKDPDVRRKAAERARKWALENPEKAWVRRQISRIKRRGLKVDGSHSAEDIKRIFKLQKGKCAYCRQKAGLDYHVDHIVPLAKGGSNYAKNLQITCAKCNMAKHARDPISHARMIGLLL